MSYQQPTFDSLGRTIGNDLVYTLDIYEPMEHFRHYHRQFANPDVSEADQAAYLHAVVEQMVAHFEVETTAVQMFVGHYTRLITDPSVSPTWRFHPLRFLRSMENEEYRNYVYCLFGFAADMLNLFLSHRLYNSQGKLLASYQHMVGDVLYLIVRPEVPDVFLY